MSHTLWHTSLPRSLMHFHQSDTIPSHRGREASQNPISTKNNWVFRGLHQLLHWLPNSLSRISRFCSCFWGLRWFNRKLEHSLQRVLYYRPVALQPISFRCNIWVSLKHVLCFEVKVKVLNFLLYFFWSKYYEVQFVPFKLRHFEGARMF